MNTSAMIRTPPQEVFGKVQAQEELNNKLKILSNPEMKVFRAVNLPDFEAHSLNYGFQDNHGYSWQVEVQDEKLVITEEFRGISPATEWIENVCDFIESRPPTESPPYWLVYELGKQIHPHNIEDIPAMLEKMEPQIPNSIDSAVEQFQKFETLLKMRITQQQLDFVIRQFRRNFEIEDVLAGEQEFDREYGYFTQEDYQLRNGDIIEEDVYPSYVNRALRRFVALKCNEGFVDCQGNRWSVEEEEPEKSHTDVPDIKLTVVGRFQGPTPLHQLIQKMKAHQEAPEYFSTVLDEYVHQNEEEFLAALPPHTREEFLRVKVLVEEEK